MTLVEMNAKLQTITTLINNVSNKIGTAPGISLFSMAQDLSAFVGVTVNPLTGLINDLSTLRNDNAVANNLVDDAKTDIIAHRAIMEV